MSEHLRPIFEVFANDWQDTNLNKSTFDLVREVQVMLIFR